MEDPISFSTTAIYLDADGRAQSFTVVAPKGEWNVTASALWLHVTPESGSGTVKVSVSADENRMDIERIAYIDFSMPGYFNGLISLTVTQAAGDGDDPGPGPDPGPGGDSPTPSGLQYLECYEIPAIGLQNREACSGSGNEKYGNTKYYNYATTNENQMVVTHTYKYDGKQYRNYTCLVDKTKLAPLWSAFVMHSEAYPDNNVGRTGSWGDDPGVPSSWQQESSSNGYSRGHLVASNYRQVCGDANKQTFYATNQALQQQNGFNGAIWEKLEQRVVAEAPSGRDTLYVTVGLLFEDGVALPSFPVPCPSHFYKLLMKCSFDSSGAMTAAKGCAYLFENISHGNSSKEYDNEKYRTTIDAIEERTGFNFYANVPAELQEAAEKSSSPIW